MFKKLKAYWSKVYSLALLIVMGMQIKKVAKEATKMYKQKVKNDKG